MLLTQRQRNCQWVIGQATRQYHHCVLSMVAILCKDGYHVATQMHCMYLILDCITAAIMHGPFTPISSLSDELFASPVLANCFIWLPAHSTDLHIHSYVVVLIFILQFKILSCLHSNRVLCTILLLYLCGNGSSLRSS